MKYRDIVKIIERDGWRLARQSGSHKQYWHPTKPGTVTISPHSMGDEVPPGTLNSIRKQALKMSSYLVIAEPASDGTWSAYVPDLPGCVCSALTRHEAFLQMRDTIAFHLEGMREHGDPIPEPISQASTVEVA